MARYLTIEDGREYLWDFDENRILLVTYGDTENIRQVEFSTDDTEGPTTWTSEVMTNLTTGNKYVQVPNEFLNGEYSRLVCYVIAEDETGQHTRTKEIFRIKKRQQPEDYEITFTDRVYIRDLKAIAERYRDQAKEYSESASASSTQAGQHNSEALASKNAAAESERNAEASMESAQSAQHGAESARNDANAILTLVQSKGTEITNFVATSKTELETQKNESLAEVRSVYTADLDELKGDLVNLANNIIDVEWTVGGYIAYNTGGIQAESETKYSRTDYISLKENPIYSIYAHWYGYVGCAFYTENKQFISGLGAGDLYGSRKRIIQIPENAVYIRFSNVSEKLPNTDTEITVNNLNKEKNGIVDYIDEQITSIKYYSDSMDNDIYKNVVTNMINFDDIENDKYVHYESGGINPLSGSSATGYIEVVEGSTVVLKNIQTATSDNRGLVYYDTKKNVQGGIQYTSKNTLKFVVPTGIKYIRATIPTSEINNALIYTLYDTSKLKEDNTNEIKYTDFLYKVVCFGDSLTVGADYTSGTYGGNMKENYPYYLAKSIGTTVDYVAHAGDSALAWYNSFGGNDYSSYDFAIIWLGTNEGLTNTSLTDISTNTGAYIAILDKLISDNTNIKIALCNCHGSSGNLTTTNQMIDSISQLSQYANNIIGVVDMFNSNLWSDEVKQLYHPNNNLHFSKVGNFHLANYVKDSINELIQDNESMFNTLVRGHGA